MRVVFVSHTAAGGVFRVGSHHLSRELARQGHEVTHVSTPVSFAHAARSLRSPEVRRRIRQSRTASIDADGVSHLVPRSALPLRHSPDWLLRADAAKQAASFRREIGSEPTDVVFVDQPMMADFALSLNPRVLVYRPTDAHFDGPSRRAELRLLEQADGIAATSAETLATVIRGSGWVGPTTVIENGVELARFSRPIDDGIRDGRVAYLGAIDHRFDWPVVVDLARAYPQLRFDVAGPARSTSIPDLPTNVVLAGPVAYEDAGDWLRGASVGLLPLSDNPGNAGRSPMKYYEYLAAGLSVVATRIPALSHRPTPNVWLFEGQHEARTALHAALQAPPELRRAGQLAATEFAWEHRAQLLTTFAVNLPGGDRR